MSFTTLKKFEEGVGLVVLGLLTLFLPILALQVLSGNLTSLTLTSTENEEWMVAIGFVYLSRLFYLIAQKVQGSKQ